MAFEYFDLDRKWDNYGSVVELANFKEEDIRFKLKQFSEGSSSLEKLLNVLYDLNITTIACCKGSHLTIETDNLPGVRTKAYVMFKGNEWLSYLSDATIKNKDIIIDDKSINYYGKNNNFFFEMLLDDFKSGKKDNIELINDKLKIKPNAKMKRACYKNSLYVIGFTDNEVDILSNLFLEYKFYNSQIKRASEENVDNIVELSDKSYKLYKDTLIQFIEEKNKSVLDNIVN